VVVLSAGKVLFPGCDFYLLKQWSRSSRLLNLGVVCFCGRGAVRSEPRLPTRFADEICRHLSFVVLVEGVSRAGAFTILR